jgi:hypothetical protein
LLDSVLTGPLNERVRDQIVAETGGNPLALLELLRGMDSSAHTCLSYPRFIYALSITPGLVTRCRPVWVIFRTLKIEASRNLGIPPGLRCQSADQFLGWPLASWLVIFREHLVSIGDTKLAGRHNP